MRCAFITNVVYLASLSIAVNHVPPVCQSSAKTKPALEIIHLYPKWILTNGVSWLVCMRALVANVSSLRPAAVQNGEVPEMRGQNMRGALGIRADAKTSCPMAPSLGKPLFGIR